jgi:hypothetical protein
VKLFAILVGGFVAWMVVLAVGLASALGGMTSAAAPGAFQPGTDIGLNAEQMKNATISLSVADELKAPPLAVLSMVVSALGESNFLVVPNAQNSGYCGVFQADPDNIPCGDTKQQATSFLQGGLGFQAGGAIYLATGQPSLSPGTIATMVEASGQPGSFYDANRAQAEKIIAAWQSGQGSLEPASIGVPDVNGALTPKEVIDKIILPMAREVGIQITAAEVEAANARHSVNTTSGNVSEHKGPPDVAWAADISDSWVSTVGSPKMTKLAGVLSKTFKIPWSGSGLSNAEYRVGPCNFRFQMIYMTMIGGDHRNHVHLGIHLLGCSRP